MWASLSRAQLSRQPLADPSPEDLALGLCRRWTSGPCARGLCHSSEERPLCSGLTSDDLSLSDAAPCASFWCLLG